jgi:hypothetical protein
MRLDVRIRMLFAGAVLWACGGLTAHAQNPAKSENALPKILVDDVKRDGVGELNESLKAIEQPTCTNSRSGYLTVSDLVGGKVNVIRVTHTLWRLRNPPTAEDLKETVREVWQRKFQGADCRILWSEMVFWSIKAVVEFDDGKKSVLLTDGTHVALQDHDGKGWFFRLLPAAR